MIEITSFLKGNKYQIVDNRPKFIYFVKTLYKGGQIQSSVIVTKTLSNNKIIIYGKHRVMEKLIYQFFSEQYVVVKQ